MVNIFCKVLWTSGIGAQNKEAAYVSKSVAGRKLTKFGEKYMFINN